MDDLIRRSDAIEAIEVVDWYHQNRNKDMVSGANSDDHQAWYKADDVYKALEAVPSADRPQGDSVSRRYLLAEIDDLADEFSEVDENGLHSERWCGISDAKCVILNAPLIADRPQGEWIPCIERLPKAEEKVWIQTERGKVCFAMYEDGTISEDDSAWHWYDLHFDKWDEENDCGIIPEGWWEWTEFHPDVEFDCPVDEVVVAWMPLPKPYKERSK